MPEEGIAIGDNADDPLPESHLSEALLWRELRGRPEGLRFDRRRNTGKYLHDFYCPDARLAIELEASVSDQTREDWLARAGISTMRIPTSRILQGSKLAAGEIISRAKGLLPKSHPALALSAQQEALVSKD